LSWWWLSTTRTCTFHRICAFPSTPGKLRPQIKKDCAAYQSEAAQWKPERYEHCGQEESKGNQRTDFCQPAGLVGYLIRDRPSQNMVLELKVRQLHQDKDTCRYKHGNRSQTRTRNPRSREWHQ
jgi:hypothetical protein